MENASENAIENRIQAAGATAPRLTPEIIDSHIAAEDYHVFKPSMKTVCCLTLKNGFTVIGEAGVVSPDNFREDIGRDVAKKNAREKIWPLAGYLLKQKLFEAGQQQPGAVGQEVAAAPMFREEGTLEQLAPDSFEEPKAS